MPISTSWYNDERRVIYQRFEGQWTWEEYYHEFTAIKSLAASVPHQVIICGDLSHTNAMPKGNALTQGRVVVGQVPENTSHIICVVQSRLLEVFGGLVLDMMPNWRNKVKFVKSMVEAERLIANAIEADTDQ